MNKRKKDQWKRKHVAGYIFSLSATTDEPVLKKRGKKRALKRRNGTLTQQRASRRYRSTDSKDCVLNFYLPDRLFFVRGSWSASLCVCFCYLRGENDTPPLSFLREQTFFWPCLPHTGNAAWDALSRKNALLFFFFFRGSDQIACQRQHPYGKEIASLTRNVCAKFKTAFSSLAFAVGKISSFPRSALTHESELDNLP